MLCSKKVETSINSDMIVDVTLTALGCSVSDIVHMFDTFMYTYSHLKLFLCLL